MLSTWLPLPRSTALYPPQQLAQAFPISPSPKSIQLDLQHLDPYKSAGINNLDPFFLQLSAKIVTTPITSLFNLFFVSSEIPKDWKAAAVIPLFKGGDTLDPNCYRPISILPCRSKVFESQVNKQITDHFESHCTFSAMQSGFRAGHGCTSAMLKVLNDILTAIDKKHYCAAVFIDLAKAFDSVNHHILIGRLALVSQMIASPGSPTTYLIEFSVSNRRACCPGLWQSLWGCHRVQFLDRLFSLYTSMMSLLLLVSL